MEIDTIYSRLEICSILALSFSFQMFFSGYFANFCHILTICQILWVKTFEIYFCVCIVS